MRVLGIDPGLATMGWGVVDAGARNPVFISCGIISTPPGMRLQERLSAIKRSIKELLEEYKPDEIVFEELFFSRNVTTALTVGAARGVAIAACAEFTPMLYEYTPMQIKQGITGYGKADKKQVQQMVKLLLNLKTVPKPDDAADALGAAICHANTSEVSRVEFRIK